MWSLAVVKGKPVHKSHIEVLVRGKSMFVEEIIVNESPKSFYLSIRLWSSYSCVFMSNIQLLKHNFKTMKMS